MSEQPTAPKKRRDESPPKQPSHALIKFLGSVFIAKAGRMHAPHLRTEIETALGTEKQWKAAEAAGLVTLDAPGTQKHDGTPGERHVALTKSGEQLLREWLELALF